MASGGASDNGWKTPISYKLISPIPQGGTCRVNYGDAPSATISPIMSSFLKDIRGLALVACVTGVLGEATVLWSLSQRRSLAALLSGPLSETWWLAAVFLVEMTLPLFLFVLYWSDGIPRFSRDLGVLALGAAFLRGLLTAPELMKWIGSLRIGSSESVLFAAHHHWTIGDLSALFAELSNVSCILLLIAFFRHARNEPGDEISASRLLVAVTKVTVFAWGLWFLMQIVLTAFTYFTMRSYLSQQGMTQAQMTGVFADAFRKLLVQMTAVIAPLIVYKSLRPRWLSAVALEF